MSKIINIKPQDQIQCFTDLCGRCGGTGQIDSLGLGFPGPCPVCAGRGSVESGTGTGHVHRFESQQLSGSLPTTRTYADGVQVNSAQRTTRKR